MAKTSSERQAAYRARHLKDGLDERINMVVSLGAAMALRCLAAHQGVTQRHVLEALLTEAQAAVTAGMTPEQQSAYFDVVSVTA